MNNKLMKGVLCGAVILGGVIGGQALAGYKSSGALYLSTTYGQVNGSLADIRSSHDAIQYLSCDTSAGPFAGTPWVECNGEDSTYHAFTCYSYDPAVMAAVQSISGDSNVYIEWDPSTGVIQFIDVGNGSQYTPKAP